jgi:hypothetical protein
MTQNAIEGKQIKLGDIFHNYAFSVPEYQRPYLWTTEQCAELLDDVLRAMGDNPSVTLTNLPEYFLGSVVLVREEDAVHHEVVDGQQRLTTLTILFAALRDLMTGIWQRSAAGCVMQDGDVGRGILEQPRVKLRRQERAFFSQHVQTEGGVGALVGATFVCDTDSQRRIRENAIFFYNGLSGLAPASRERLFQYLLQKTILVVVTAGDRGSAVRIFAVMNNRGLDLQLSDILKSELIDLAALEGEALDEFTQSWERVEQEVGRDAFQIFFAHVRMISEGRRPKEEILKEFKDRVLPRDRNDLRRYVTSDLFEFAKAYQRVLQVPRPFASTDLAADEAIAVSLHWLRYIDNTDWVPAAMYAFMTLEARPTDLAKALSAIERIASSMMIRREDVNKRVARFAEVVTELKAGRVGMAGTRLDLDATERSKTLQRLDGDLYQEHRNVVRLVLARLEDVLSSTPPHAANKSFHQSLSTEHVLPQSVDFANTQAGSWGSWYSPADHATHVHRLGNLALLSRNKNAQASNADFATKKARYFLGPGGTTNFATTSQVLSEATWDLAVLQRHHTSRLAALQLEWSL